MVAGARQGRAGQRFPEPATSRMPIPEPPLDGSVLLMRHGEADWDRLGQGHALGHGTDLVPLTQQGIDDVRNLARAMAGLGLQRVVSSPLTRALQSAFVVAEELELPLPEVEFDLREWQPTVAGLPLPPAEIDRALNALWSGVLSEEYDGSPFEDVASLRNRVRVVLSRQLGSTPTLIVTHGVVIWSMTSVRLMTADVVSWALAELNSDED